jgi:outer membrane protein assembly factor BamA
MLCLEYVYDNAIAKATNIMNGLRYKVYFDVNSQINDVRIPGMGRQSFNFGFDGRYYYPIYRNFIWAGRVAGDFSWGDQKVLYYLGGVDGWLLPKADQGLIPQDNYYAFQSLAVNMRGFNQNISNGNNAVVINSEFRFPVFSTLLNRPINNAFLRNFQVTQFIDLGSAWNGAYNKLSRPSVIYPPEAGPVQVKFKAGGIGPFVGGYGFGVRSTLLGYFLRLDAGWEMNGLFRDKPILYFGMGVDF